MKKKLILFIALFLSYWPLQAQPGTYDQTFSPAVISNGFDGQVYALAYQPDGKIIVGGIFNFFNGIVRTNIARLNGNGTLDSTFNAGVLVNTTIGALALQPDGKILVGTGSDTKGILRLNTDGSLDNTFNPGIGIGLYDVRALSLQPDGKVIAGGGIAVNGVWKRIVRLNTDGSLDNTFNPGTGFNEFVMSLALQPDGKIIAGGWFTSFNGTTTNYVARLNSNGSLDNSFSSGAYFDSSYVWAVCLQPNGKIIVGGSVVSRLNSDGSADNTFNPGTVSPGSIHSLAYQPDGKIIIGGGFDFFNGTVQKGLARLNSDGSLDNGFNTGAGFEAGGEIDNGVRTLLIQPDGKILAGGNFAIFNGVARHHIARLIGGENISRTVPEADSLALVDIYNSTDGANWSTKTNWLTGKVTSWSGVTVVGGRVTKIYLNSKRLSGSIPSSIGNLTALQYLTLVGNQLTGSIPTSIGNLTALKELSLSYNNSLTGNIPSSIGNLTALEYLGLSYNQLTGSIPASIGNLIALKSLYLTHNQLSGSIPDSIGRLTLLIDLILDINQLTGSIPSSIGNLTALRYFDLSYNQLTGSIPVSIGNLTTLWEIGLNNNQFITLPIFRSNFTVNQFRAQNNHLTFESLEINIGKFSSPSYYSSQDSVGLAANLTLAVGQSLQLSALVGGANNRYQWTRNGIDIVGATNASLSIPTITAGQQGWYSCKITNTTVVELTLNRRRVFVKVTVPVNTVPTISSIANQTVCQNATTASLPFTIGDAETATTALILTGASSNTALVPNANIIFGGSAANRTVKVTPTTGQSGTATITLTVTDGAGAKTSTSFILTVNALPTINAVANQTVVTGAATTAINFSGTGDAVVNNWTNTTPSIGLPASGMGNIPSFTATNSSSSPLVATITATPSSVSGGFAYVANRLDKTVSVVNPINNQVIATIPVGEYPQSLVASPDGSRVYVTNYYSNDVSVINTKNNSVITTVPAGTNPSGIVITPDGNRIYVTNYLSNKVTVINTQTNKVVATVAAEQYAYGIAISPDGSRVYVTNVAINTVSVINTSTNQIIATAPTGSGPIGIVVSPKGSRLYVTNGGSNTVSVINTNTNQEIATIPVGEYPYDIAVSPDGSRVYVTNGRTNNISVINTSTNSVVATTAVGSSPEGITVSADGSRVYVTNYYSNNVSIINTSTNSVVSTIETGSGAQDVSVGAGSLGCSGTSKSFTISVNPTNTAPTITSLGSQILCQNTATATLSFTIGDKETSASALKMAGTSSNTTVVPNTNIIFGGTDANRTVKITPVSNQSGTTTITLTVTDGAGIKTSTSFILMVNAWPVAYNVTGSGAYCSGGTGVAIGLSNSQAGVNYQLRRGVTNVGSAKTGNGSALSFGNQLVAGTYTVVAVNTTTACSQVMSGSATVTVNPIPNAPTASANTPFVGGTLNLSASTITNASYQWTGPNGFSSNQQNPTLAKVTASNAGSYFVIAKVGGCTSSASSVNVIIKPATTTSVTLDLDSVGGAANTEVVVPVRVKDFKNILSMQGSIGWDQKVASFIKVEGFGLPVMSASNFGTTQVTSGKLSFSWFDASLKSQSLTDNTVLFSLRFKLVGSKGARSSLTFSSNPVPVEIVDVAGTVLSANLQPGTVSILSTVNISGMVTSVSGSPLNATNLKITDGIATQTLVTAADGTYQFEVNSGGNYTIQPSKNNGNVTNGITTLDVVLTQRHILQIAALDSPYKIIAADVNGSGTVTTLDLVLIRSLILLDRSSFPGNKLWAFVQSDFNFPNPTNPFPFDSIRTFSKAITSTGQNFIGVKLGDVNDSWDASSGRISGDESITFKLTDQVVLPNTEIMVPIQISDFTKIGGYQFTLNWDPTILEYQGIVNQALEGNFGLSQIIAGKLTTSWNDPKGSSQTLPDEQTVFNVKFAVIGNVGSESPISINSSMTQSVAYSEELTPLHIQSSAKVVRVMDKEIEQTYKLEQNQPNPFESKTIIKFGLPQQQLVTITIYNALGQVIKTIRGDFAAGEHKIEWNGQGEGGQQTSSGTYFYQMKAGNFVGIKKLMINK